MTDVNFPAHRTVLPGRNQFHSIAPRKPRLQGGAYGCAPD